MHDYQKKIEEIRNLKFRLEPKRNPEEFHEVRCKVGRLRINTTREHYTAFK